ncbi:hypothetical protein BSLA_02r3389 [Burkholderia stabilis]|nr:hypothetical protein BSLA_02r3389 [Burkholderia stabilis]
MPFVDDAPFLPAINNEISQSDSECTVPAGGIAETVSGIAETAGGIAETVSGGHGPHGRRAGRRSGVRATDRARTASTIREVPGAGNRTGGEKRRKAGNRGVSRQLAARGCVSPCRPMRVNRDRNAMGKVRGDCLCMPGTGETSMSVRRSERQRIAAPAAGRAVTPVAAPRTPA